MLNGAVLCGALIDQGELDEAERVLATFDEEVEAPSLTSAVLRLAPRRAPARPAPPGEGLDDLLAVGAITTRTFVTCPSYLPWRSAAALAAFGLDRREYAEHLAAEEVVLARSFGAHRALGVALRSAGVIAGGDSGESLLREALDCFTIAGAAVERARTLGDLGALLRRRNRRTEARELLRESLDVAHRAGARPLAERAETELRATGARPRRVVLTGLDALTASERRVAELAGQELTNREIAQSLFVTVRTVEGHLTNVFRKLRLDSREELAGVLAGSVVPV